MSKKAVLVGINYFGTSCELRGCHNDVDNVRDALLNMGFQNENILTLKDSRSGRGKLEPTRKNILHQWSELIRNSKKGDLLYIHYSGHGSYTRDRDGDERDGRDELICPADHTSIVDDELFDMLVMGLPKDVKLRVVFDCCHSGSALDLPTRYMYGYHVARENRYVKNKDIVMISGCRDNQTSADAWIGGFTGALTWAFLKAMTFADKHDKNMSWQGLLHEIRHYLKKEGYTQVPQLSMSKRSLVYSPIDLL